VKLPAPLAGALRFTYALGEGWDEGARRRGVWNLPDRPHVVTGHRPISIPAHMQELSRIQRRPTVMGGKPCIRGTRVTVGTVVGLIASGRRIEEILDAYPYLTQEDIQQALSYAAWRSEEVEVPLAP